MLHTQVAWQDKKLGESKFGESLRDLGFDPLGLQDEFFVLDNQALAEFWNLNFGNDGSRRRIPDGWWGYCCPHIKVDIEWDNYTDSMQVVYVTKALGDRFDFPPEEPLCFFGGIEVIATTWRCFCECWNAFYDLNDEGICCLTRKNEGLRFSPLNSILHFGE